MVCIHKFVQITLVTLPNTAHIDICSPCIHLLPLQASERPFVPRNTTSDFHMVTKNYFPCLIGHSKVWGSPQSTSQHLKIPYNYFWFWEKTIIYAVYFFLGGGANGHSEVCRSCRLIHVKTLEKPVGQYWVDVLGNLWIQLTMEGSRSEPCGYRSTPIYPYFV